jgi:hypothetical protein
LPAVLFATLLPCAAMAQVPGNAIVTDGRTQTQITVTGRTTNITTSTINGGNAYNSFSQFVLGGGNTANLYVPSGANDLINIVRNGTAVVNGTLNGYQNGAIGGNIFFADPYGFVVGAGGVINVGSLTVTTPSKQYIESLISSAGVVDNAAAAQLIAGTVPLSSDGVIFIRGQVNAQSGVTLNGVKVAIAGPRGKVTPAVQREHKDGDKHWKLFQATVNTDGLQQGGSVVVQNGTIEIAAEDDASIGGTLVADGSSGQNAGTITATAGHNLTVAATAVISAAGHGANSSGGHIKLDAGNNTTIADGADLSAAAGSSGDGGKIELSATGTLRLGAATLDTGAEGGQAGSVLIDPTNVVIGPDPTVLIGDQLGPQFQIPTQGSIDTNGGNVDITATNSITLESGAYINTRQTVASGGTPAGNDTTDRSLGNSGNITLDAPSMTLDGQLNAFAINVPGTTFTPGTITLTGLGAATIGSGGNLPSFDTNGANLVINASSIAFESGGYLNTRATTFGNANDTADVSTDNSGSITLNAPSLNLAGGQLNAFTRNAGTTYSNGTIILTGLATATIGSGGNLPSFDTDGANLVIDASGSITLNTGAYINTLGNAVGSSNDTADVSLGNAGNITLNAPSLTLNGTLNAFAINGGGTAYAPGTITLTGLGAATVGNGGNLPNFSTGGANLVIDASTSITLASGAYINTRQTSVGAGNDTSADSSGNSGNITLDTPSLTLGGQLNAFALNTTGSSATTYSPGTITLMGLSAATIGTGGTLPNFYTEGANLVIDAASSIGFETGGYINTRETSFGAGNDTSAGSTGNSGNITLDTPSLNLGTGQLNAFAIGTTYAPGTITLMGLGSVTIGGNLASLDTRGAGLTIDASTSITLDSGAYINTRATGTTTADDTADNSTGNSGAVTLSAPTISVSGPINAFALNGGGTTYTGGAVALVGTSSGSITVNQANVVIGTAGQSYITSIVSNGGNISITGTSSITLESDAIVNAQNSAAGTVAFDLSASAAGNSGSITLNAPTIGFIGGINPENAPSNAPSSGALLLAGANNGFAPGTVTLTGPSSFTFDSSDPVYGAGANLAIDASSSITLAAGGLIDIRGDGYANAVLTAPAISFASGINSTGGFAFYATPRDSQGVGTIQLAAGNGFILGAGDPIKSLGANIELDASGGTIALGANALIDSTVSGADAGDITLSAATVSFANGINNGGSTPQLLAGAPNGFEPGTIALEATNGFSLTGADPIKSLGANIDLDTFGTTLTLGGGSIDSRLSGANSGNIILDAATIVLDSGINNGSGSMALLAGPSGSFAPGTIFLDITGGGFNLQSSGLAINTLGANLTIDVTAGALGLTDGATGGVIDSRVQTAGLSTANSGNISLIADGIDFAGGINGVNTGPTVQLLAGATGGFLPGGISLTDTGTDGGFTFDSSNPVKTLGASIAFFATGSGGLITLNSGSLIDSRTGTGSTVNSGNITLSAPSVAFASGINNGGSTPQLLAQSNGSGAGAVNLIATASNGGFTLNAADPIVTSGASLELIATGASGFVTVASNGVINAGTGGLTLSATTVSVAPGASLTDSGVTLSQSNFVINGTNSLTLPGQNVTLDASGSITILAGGYIDTRDWTAGFSTGNSGSITLDAPTITLNGGTTPSGYTLDAGVSNTTGSNPTTFTAGDVTLTATANTTPTYPGGLYTTTTGITLQNDAKIRGKTVSLTASSTTDVNFSASAGSTAAGLAVDIAEGLLAGINVNVLGATSNASVDVQNGSSITATGDVLLSSLGSETVSFPDIVIQGALLPGSLAILYGADKATISTSVEGTVTAGGNLTVASYNSATISLQAWADSNPLFNSGKVSSGSLYAGGVTDAYGNVSASALIAANATIAAAGQVAILARADNSIDTATTALALGNSAVGFAVAITDFTSNATATDAADLGTGTDKVGSVLIEADNDTVENVTKGSTTTGANALTTVLSQLSAPGGAVGLGVGGTEALALGAVVGSGIPQALSTSAGSNSPIKIAATVAYASESMNATADIAGATGAVAPDVQSSGPVAVYAQVYDTGVRLDADSSVGSAGPANANAISTGSNISISVALMLGFIDQDASAYIGPGSIVTGSDVGVGSQVVLPIDNLFACADNPCSLSEFTSHLNGNFGLANDLATTYVSAASQANVFGIAGAVDYFDLTDTSSAWIADGAQVTGTATGSAGWATAVDQGALAALPASWPAVPTGLSSTVGWATPLTVTALVDVQSVDISGNICLSFNCTGGSSAGASSVGGSFAFVDYNDSAIAGIGADANVSALGDLTVAAKVDDEAITISPTSGYGAANSLAGLVVLTDFNENAHASISDTAEISAPDVNVDATQNLTIWSITGGVIAGTTTGVGISVSVNQVDTDTLAFVGDNSADELNSLGSGLGLPYTPAVAVTAGISTNDLNVIAGSSGDVGAVSVAAALAISSAPSADPPSGISSALSSFTSLLNGNGLGFSSLATAAGGAGTTVAAVAPPTFGLSITGSSSVDQTDIVTEAYLKNATVQGYSGAANANAVTVQAVDDTYLVAGSGSASFVSAGSPAATASAAIAGALALLLTNDDTVAFVAGSTVHSQAIAVQALAGAAETAVAIGLSVNISSPDASGFSGAGSVSVAILKDATDAYVDDSTLSGNSTGTAGIVAYDHSEIGIGGGALAVTPSAGGAFGAAVTYVETDDPSQSGDDTGKQVDARIEGSTVTGYTSVTVFGLDIDQIVAGSFTAAVAPEGTGFSGSATVAILNGTTDAAIVNDGSTASSLSTVGSVTVLASGDSDSSRDAAFNTAISNLGTLTSDDVDVAVAGPSGSTAPGASIVSFAGGFQVGKNSVGLSIVYNGINETRNATISDASITTDAALCSGACTVDVTATDNDNIQGFAVGLSVALGSYAGAGSAVANVVSNTITAQIGNTTAANTTITAPSVGITANDNATIESFAGQIAAAPDGAAGGAAIAYNKIGAVNGSGGKVTAEADKATFDNNSSLTVSATSDGTIETAAIAGAAGDDAAFAGSFTTNFSQNTIDAALSGISYNNTAGTISVTADDTQTIQSLAGSASFSPDGAIGAGLAVNQINDSTTAEIDGATGTSISAKDVTVQATAGGNIETLAIGIAISGDGVGGAGSIATNLNSESVTAEIGGGADVTAQDNVGVIAGNTQTVGVIAGSLGGGTSVIGAGLSLIVNELSDTTEAKITGATTKVDALGTDSGDTLTVNTGTLADPPGLTNLTPTATPPSLAETTTPISGLAVVATSEQGATTNAVTIGASVDLISIGASANIVTDIMGGTTKAHIDDASIDTRLTADPTVSGYVGPQLYVDASSQAWTGNLVISAAGGGYAGTAAAVGASLDRETDAYITGATVGTLYTATATTSTPIGSVDNTVGGTGGVANDDGTASQTTIYQNDETKTLVPSLGAVTVRASTTQDSLNLVTGLAVGFGGGGAGTVIVNVFSGNTNAYVTGGTLNAGSLTVSADTAAGFAGDEGSGAGSVGNAVAGAFAVDVGGDTTLAYVGDPTGDTTTTVNLTGALNVAATTENTLNTVVVSVGIAGGAGVAAMADVTVITNTTTGSLYSVDLNTPVPSASVTTTTTTDGIGNITTVTDMTVDGDVNAPSGAVTVSANETINVTPQAGAGGAGVSAGIGAGANVVVLKSDTTAQIVASTLNVAGSDVSVLAQSTKDVDATTGTVGAGLSTGIGATVALVLIGSGGEGDVSGQLGGTLTQVNTASDGGVNNPDPSVGSGSNDNSATAYSVSNALASNSNDAVTATIAGGTITAAQVSVTANSFIGTSNFTTAVAVGGDAGIGGAVSFTRVYDTVTASTVGGTVITPSLSLTADAGDSSGNHTASDTATAGGGGIVGLGAAVSDALVDNNVTASLGGTVTAPAGATSPVTVSVDAADTSSIYSLAAGGGVGAVAVGVMVANAGKTSSVTAEIPNAGSTETLSTAATAGMSLTITATDAGQVRADAYGASGGLLGAGTGAGAAASDTANITAEIGTGNALNIGDGSVGITASDTPDAEANAFGVAVGGGAGLGASVATATANPTVLATVGDNASIGGSGGLAINATLSLPSGGNSTSASATIGTGGILLSANASVATAQATPSVIASTGTDVHLPDGNVSLTANSLTSQNASATGVAVGGEYAVGTSLAFAETGTSDTPGLTQAEIGAGATGSADRTGALAVRATGTDDETASTVAGSGAIVAGNATVATTTDNATVNAQVDGSASATGATNLAVGALVITAIHYDNFSATADSVNAAAFGGSGSGVSNSAAATTTASIGDYVTLTVNSDALISAQNNFSDANGGQSAEGAAGGVLNGAAAISETSLCSSSTPCAADVTLGDHVTLSAGTDPVLNPGGIDLVAVTMLQGSDQVDLTTGGAIAGAGVTSHFSGTFANTVTTGSNDTLTSEGDLDIGSYDQLFFSTVANVSTYGLGVAGIADATTTINPSQTVIIGSNDTLTALGNVNLTAGNDPTGGFNSIVNGSATAVAYVYGVITIPSASATVNETVQTAVTINSGTKVQSAQNVNIGGFPSVPIANADGEAHFDELGIPISESDSNPNVATPTAVVTINGTVTAGIYYDLDVMIPNCANSGGYFCSELQLTDGSFDNLGNALTSATTGMPLTVVAGAPADVAIFDANFNPGSLSSVLPSGVASGTVGAFAFGPLLASAGVVNLNATSFSGTGTITANGAPSITVRNFSPDYLVMSSVLIPDLAGGSINFTGSASSSAATAAGLHVNPVNPNGTPTIDIENDYGINYTPNGPALYVLGSANLPGFLVTPANTTVTGIVSLSGDITIINKLGSYGATEAVLGNQVNISIPNGFAVINIPDPPGIEPVGGNPFSEWADYIVWPGGNPANNAGFNGNVAAAYLANAVYNANGTYTSASAFTGFLIGNTGNTSTTGSTAIFYGDCEYELAGDCSGSTAQSIANTMPGSGTYGFAGGGNIEVQVPIETLNISTSGTLAQQYALANLAGSSASTAVYGNNVHLTAAIIDLGGTISAGRATNWTVTLPSSLMTAPSSSQELVGYTLVYEPFSFGSVTLELPVTVPVYQTYYSGGGAIANFAANYNAGLSTATTLDLTPYLAPINPNTTNNNALPEVATYNAQTNTVTIEGINASSAGGVLQLNGAIVATNQLGTIHMNAGLGQVAVNNSTGLALDTTMINAGSNAANGTVSSMVDIIDTLQPFATQQTWYVFTPGSGVVTYQGNGSLTAPPATPDNNLSTTSYQPLIGERFEWLEQATLTRQQSSTSWNLGNWQFTNQFGASSNLPWVYLSTNYSYLVGSSGGTGFEVGAYGLSQTPQGWLINNTSLENTAFKETITGGVTGTSGGPYYGAFHGCGGNIGDGCHYGYTENTNPGPDNNGDPAAVWHWNFITDGYLQMTVSVKADNLIGVNFSGSPVGSVTVTSNGAINIDGQITNPNGNTTITATNGGILTAPVIGLVTSDNLTLSASGGIGAAGQLFNATLGGDLSATGGSQGVYVNLNSGAVLGTVSAQTGSSYGPVTIVATGDLLAASNTSLVAGSQITLSTTQGAIGSTGTPLNINNVGPVTTNYDGSISGAVTASAENDIVLTQLAGNFNVLSVASVAGNVVLTADAGNILDARGVTGAAALAPAQLHLTAADGAAAAATANSVTPFNNLVNAEYQAYYALLQNGTVSNGTFTLNSAAVPLYAALAGTTGMTTQQYAQHLYATYTGDFATYIGADWASQSEFAGTTASPTYTFALSASQIAANTANSVWTPAQLQSFVQSSALAPASTVVGTGTPNVTGRNVTLISHAATGVDGDIGALAPSLPVLVSDLTSFNLSTAQEGALELAIAPGEIVLEGKNAQNQIVTIDFAAAVAAGQFPTGVTPYQFVVQQTAPFFLTASGTTTANAAGAIYLQSSGANMTIANITAGDSINLAADESIVASGSAPQVVAGGSLTMAANGSIGASGAPVNYTVGGDLLSAVAGGNAYVEYDGGNMVIGQVGAGQTAWVDSTHGGIVADPTLLTFNVIGGSVVLTAQTNIGSALNPLQVETTDALGSLTGTAGTTAYLTGIGSGALNIATLTAPTGIDIVTLTTVPLTAGTLTASNGFVTVNGGNSVAIDDLTAGNGAADVTAVGAMTFGAATGSSLLSSSGSFTIDAGGAFTVEPDTEIRAGTGATVTAASLAMDAGSKLDATQQIEITTSGDAELGQVSTTFNGDHAIDVTAGTASNGCASDSCITELGAISANGDSVINLTANGANDKIYLTATNGVGALDQLLTVETPLLSVSTIDGDIGIYAKQFSMTASLLSALFGNVTFDGDANLTLNQIVAGEQIVSDAGLAGSGFLALGTTTSGGSQTFQAVGDVSFTSLTSTGITGDRGDISLTSTAGAVHGVSATPSALTGTIDANGGIGVTAHTDIEIATLDSQGSQVLAAATDIDYTTIDATGLSPDNGNVSAVTSGGSINGHSLTTNGTATLEAEGSGGAITVNTVTSGGAQILDADDNVSFATLTTNGLSVGGVVVDNGNLSVISAAGTVSGTTVDVYGTALIQADGTSGAVTIDHVTSGGQQEIDASGNIEFVTLTTTGLGSDHGNLIVDASSGSVLGEGSTPSALTGTIDANGTLNVTAGDAIEVASLTSNGAQTLAATNDIDFHTIATNGLSVAGTVVDNGNLSAITSAGTVNGHSVTVYGTALIQANGSGGTITIDSVGSGGQQELDATNNIEFVTLTTTGLSPDNGNLIVDAALGSVLGEGSVPGALTGTVSANGTLDVTAGNAIEVSSLTSNGAQTLAATNDIDFTTVTTHGLSVAGTVVDNGNLSAIAAAGSVNGGTVTVNGTMLIQALGSGGAITIDHLTGGGAATLDADTNVEFASLQTNGLGSDNGNILIDAVGGTIAGEGATPAALTGTIDGHGTVGLTSSGNVELASVTSRGTQTYLVGGDLDFSRLTTTGMTGDAGDVDGTVTGAINGGSIDANGSVNLLGAGIFFGHIDAGNDVTLNSTRDITGDTIVAGGNLDATAGYGPGGFGSMTVQHITASSATLEATDTLTLPDVNVKTALNLGANIMNVMATQIPAVPGPTLPLQMNMTGFDGAIATLGNLNIDAPAGLAIGNLAFDNLRLITSAEVVSIAKGLIVDTMYLSTPDPIIWINNQNPQPINGVNVQLYQQGGTFSLTQNYNTTITSTDVVNYQLGYGVISTSYGGSGNYGGTSVVRDIPRQMNGDGVWTDDQPIFLEAWIPVSDGDGTGPAVNLAPDEETN